MRKAIVLLTLATAGLAFGANDAWKTKPYQQWDATDLKQVLWNSAWIKYSSVPVEWKPFVSGPLNAGRIEGDQTGRPAGPLGGNGAYGNSGNSQAAPPVASGNQDATINSPNASFFVRWDSAQTIREGLARQAVLDGKLSEAQAQQYVSQAQASYQLQVAGADMTAFMDETEDSLKSKVALEVKPSKKKLAPSEVQITRGADGKTIQTIVFSFPKQDASGQVFIAQSDKQAHFDCKLKLAHLDATFDLRKMTGKNGQEL